MIVVRGKRQVEMTADEFAEMRGRFQGVTVDLGTGDGAWGYRYAKGHPERLVVAVDPVAENLREYSARAAKKAERGGLANVLYVVGSVERLPSELRGAADEVFVTLPWGSLMRGLILGEDEVVRAVASLGRDGAVVRIVLNTRIFEDPVPVETRDLPELSPSYARETLAPRYAAARMRIEEARWMEAEEVASLGTTWAKRLSHRAPPRSVVVVGRVEAGARG
jgi:16S rRNA (adenine(1408)-N(1))-methyltransferase